MRQTLSVDGVLFAVSDLPESDVAEYNAKRVAFEMMGLGGGGASVELTSREAQALLAMLSGIAGVGLPKP